MQTHSKAWQELPAPRATKEREDVSLRRIETRAQRGELHVVPVAPRKLSERGVLHVESLEPKPKNGKRQRKACGTARGREPQSVLCKSSLRCLVGLSSKPAQ